MDEASKNWDQYASIGDLFTRTLKPGTRPIAHTPLIHPCDSQITENGPIEKDRLIQTKGKYYHLGALLEDAKIATFFYSGSFITYYLCPTDYHRVHSPVTGEIESIVYIPGSLWPVNQVSVRHINNLFSVNERVIVNIESKEVGKVSVVFVGATNVGKITLSFDPSLVSNQLIRNRKAQKVIYSAKPKVIKGEELGVFHMGSTIILLLQKKINIMDFQKVKMGDPFKIEG